MVPHAGLADLAERYWAFQCEELPITAIAAGAPSDASQLLREAPADHIRRADWARKALAELAMIEAASLTVEDRATHALLDHELRLSIELVDCGGHLRPVLYPLGPEFTLIYWANRPRSRRRQTRGVIWRGLPPFRRRSQAYKPAWRRGAPPACPTRASSSRAPSARSAARWRWRPGQTLSMGRSRALRAEVRLWPLSPKRGFGWSTTW